MSSINKNEQDRLRLELKRVHTGTNNELAFAITELCLQHIDSHASSSEGGSEVLMSVVGVLETVQADLQVQVRAPMEDLLRRSYGDQFREFRRRWNI